MKLKDMFLPFVFSSKLLELATDFLVRVRGHAWSKR
jgi:hypothetical protein